MSQNSSVLSNAEIRSLHQLRNGNGLSVMDYPTLSLEQPLPGHEDNNPTPPQLCNNVCKWCHLVVFQEQEFDCLSMVGLA